MSGSNMISNLRNDQRFPCKDFEEGNRVRRYDLTLTATQVKALDTWTQVLAGVEDQAIQISGVVLVKEAGTAYSGEYTIEMRYTDADGAKVIGDVTDSWLNATTKKFIYRRGVDVDLPAGEAVGLVSTAAPETGTGGLKVEITYRLLT
jgi:hypothetical protein